jgi:hypothetical protein
MRDPNHYWAFDVDLKAGSFLGTANRRLDRTVRSAGDAIAGTATTTSTTTRARQPESAAPIAGTATGTATATRARQPAVIPGPDTPIAGVAKTIPDASKTAIARLSSVKVEPLLGGVRFQFTARPGANPLIHLSKSRAIVGAGGLSSFPNAQTMTANRDSNASSSTVTTYAGSSIAQRVKMDQGASYQYIITVPGDAAVPTQQVTGEFRTLAQKVIVRFSHVNLLSTHDSDDEWVNFDFWVNPGEPVTDYEGTILSEWPLGRRTMNTELTLDGAEQLRLVVKGRGVWNRVVDGCLLEPDVKPASVWTMGRPGTTNCSHWNYAKAEFDANTLRGKNLPFVLRATLGPHGSKLAFDVNGSIEVVTPK